MKGKQRGGIGRPKLPCEISIDASIDLEMLLRQSLTLRQEVIFSATNET